MKNMKKVISTLLMLSIMAAMLCVPAFAAIDANDSVVVTASKSTYRENSGETINIIAQLYRDAGDNLNGHDVFWYKNGVQVSQSSTDATGRCVLPASVFETDSTVFEARVKIGDGYLTNSCTVTLERVPTYTANDYISLNISNEKVQMNDTIQILATVNGVQNNALVKFESTDSSIAGINENGYIITNGLGTVTINAYIIGNEAVNTSCTVSVVSNDADKTKISINPIPSVLQKGQTIDIYAGVSGSAKVAVFDHWHLDSADAAYVSLGYDKSPSTTLTARAATNSPVTLYAFAKDGTSTYVQFTIAANENLELVASSTNVKKGETTYISVANAFVGEEFTWSIVPSAQYGVITNSTSFGSNAELTAGPLEGRVTVTATSRADASRTDSISIYVNSEGAFGGAMIKPEVATWQKGQGALKFEVYPAFFKAYMDGKLLASNSGYYTYYNGILTINSSLLSTLSSGEHVLKVYTSSNEGIDGLVYATIYVTGSASNVYGDNAHVRGSGYNLYFTSTDPIKEVYISNQWIDPANYVLTNNGTGLTLKSDFLNKLGYGSYTMKLSTQNGYTQNANFRIVTANYAPATGDDANMGAWMALLIMSLAGAVALIPRRKKSTDLIG